MAESTFDLSALPKAQAWLQVEQQARSVLLGVEDDVCAMATISCLVHHAFGFLWTGFYRVVKPGQLLRVGPYQGTLGCLEIPFGRGVCGTAAASAVSQVVADVHAFAGHISCDARSASEIVVPVFDRQGALLAVFDIDSEKKGTFEEIDRESLERLLRWFRGA